jgi:hypothetical protein
VTWHTFRHTFASRLTRNGADLVTMKELLGHSSVSVTMRYAHTNCEAKRRAVGLIARNGRRQNGDTAGFEAESRLGALPKSDWEIR